MADIAGDNDEVLTSELSEQTVSSQTSASRLLLAQFIEAPRVALDVGNKPVVCRNNRGLGSECQLGSPANNGFPGSPVSAVDGPPGAIAGVALDINGEPLMRTLTKIARGPRPGFPPGVFHPPRI